MAKAKVLFDKNFIIGEIDKRLSGSFVEHLGNCLYGGIYDPSHPESDAHGFREDVKSLIKELGVTAIRYPGGNFVSGYNWKDGIGPKEERPHRREMAWKTIETNQVGINEFAAYLKGMDIELIEAVNLGTGTPMEAGELVDYCNGGGNTYWSDLRKKHGVQEPHGIELWCLGNEMDGEWQINMLTAKEYARKAKEAAKIIKWMDSKAKLIACGTCTNEVGHTSFGEWDRIVLEEAYDYIDYISLHRYFNYRPGKQLAYPMHDDISDIPFFFRDLQDYLDTIISVCDFIKGKNRKNKTIHISFDEWGVVTQDGAVPGGQDDGHGYAQFELLDAVIYGGLLCTFLNNVDRIKIACQSLLVNAGGMISAVPGRKAIRQAVFYPFRDVARLARGVSLRPVAELPEIETNHHGAQKSIAVAAAHDGKHGKLHVFIMNCDLREDCELTLTFGSFGRLKGLSHSILYNDDIHLANNFQNDSAVSPQTIGLKSPENGTITVLIQKHSWNVLSFETDHQ
ncbi:MAG: alpha-N-arabinofuranosidase [Treponema sp.]|jgi:alpha-N-arabinofuranosidase|nr:alpha-N-arabinofuranosidase [Treponema sp.]